MPAMVTECEAQAERPMGVVVVDDATGRKAQVVAEDGKVVHGQRSSVDKTSPAATCSGVGSADVLS